MQLQSGGGGCGGVEWTDDPDEEVDTLHSFVRTFIKDLQTITKTMKQRTVLCCRSRRQDATQEKVRQPQPRYQVLRLFIMYNLSGLCLLNLMMENYIRNSAG